MNTTLDYLPVDMILWTSTSLIVDAVIKMPCQNEYRATLSSDNSGHLHYRKAYCDGSFVLHFAKLGC